MGLGYKYPYFFGITKLETEWSVQYKNDGWRWRRENYYFNKRLEITAVIMAIFLIGKVFCSLEKWMESIEGKTIDRIG